MSFLLSLFNAPPTPEIYTLSLHDALPISRAILSENRLKARLHFGLAFWRKLRPTGRLQRGHSGESRSFSGEEVGDRKSTRLNSSHRCISYAVFCLKKKKINDDALI